MSPPPQRLVFAPDFLAASFLEPDAAEVLNRWRDGVVQPVVNRQLLLRYMKILHRLDLPPHLIRRWGWWFTAPNRAIWIDLDFPANLTGRQLCCKIAGAGLAECILSRSPEPLMNGSQPGQPGAVCISPRDYLKKH